MEHNGKVCRQSVAMVAKDDVTRSKIIVREILMKIRFSPFFSEKKNQFPVLPINLNF